MIKVHDLYMFINPKNIQTCTYNTLKHKTYMSTYNCLHKSINHHCYEDMYACKHTMFVLYERGFIFRASINANKQTQLILIEKAHWCAHYDNTKHSKIQSRVYNILNAIQYIRHYSIHVFYKTTKETKDVVK
jgi:hypothetical protein